jgi:hypothetical protein
MAGAGFTWYRIKTRGVATFLEETRQSIAIQNSKDVMTFKATKRLLLILWNRSSQQGQQLYDRHRQKQKKKAAKYQQEAEERTINKPPGFYKDDKGNEYYWDGQQRAYRDYRGRRWGHFQEHKRTRRGDWIDWMESNVHPNTPPWLQGVNRGIYEWLLMMAVIFIVGTALIILLVVAVNMG